MEILQTCEVCSNCFSDNIKGEGVHEGPPYPTPNHTAKDEKYHMGLYDYTNPRTRIHA